VCSVPYLVVPSHYFFFFWGCKDPIQKERYLKGLDILKRNN